MRRHTTFAAMRKISIRILLLGLACTLAACPSKKNDGGGSATGSDPKAVDKPVSCPPGNAIKDGACVVVVTPEKVAVVAQQQSRLEELAKLLDQVETAGAPIELMNGFRQ